MRIDANDQSRAWRMAEALGDMSWFDRLAVYYVLSYSFIGIIATLITGSRIRAVWSEMGLGVPFWLQVAANPLTLSVATLLPLAILVAGLRAGPRLIARMLVVIAAVLATAATAPASGPGYAAL